MSTQIDLGPVLSVPKGDWNASTTYERLNLVRHNSAAWICNVDTSIGVEPSEDSTDWYLQVKDTSAVSSVNGMRGDVEITTIQTPSDDSNDTSIANTEWVCDRIDETINSTHSYIDNAINTATTSILDTAAQDASNKATVAVNQALAAGETKFVTKEIANSLTDNISILVEHNAEQDEAISSAQNVAIEAQQEVANCLKTSGGSVQGRINLLSTDTVNAGKTGGAIGDNNLCLRLTGGPFSFADSGAYIQLYAKNHAAKPGWVDIVAQNDSNSTTCTIKPDGTFTKSNYDVLTSAGGEIDGTFRTSVSNVLQCNVDNLFLEIFGATTYKNGAYIRLDGKDGPYSGSFILATGDGSSNYKLQGSGKELTWCGKPVPLPTGSIIAFAANSDPSGYLICNGAAVSRTTYADLFAAIGTTYGAGDGKTTFNVPDLMFKFIEGSYTAGTVMKAGLPNVAGGVVISGGNLLQVSGGYGALYNLAKGTAVTAIEGNSAANQPVNLGMDLSKANTIYGNSATVQPPALTMRYYIKY